MQDLEAREGVRLLFEQVALTAGRSVQVEMNEDHTRYRFTRTATVVKNMGAPGGHLTVLRLDRPVFYWSWFPRLAKWVAVHAGQPSYKMVDGKAMPTYDHAYVDVYAVKGTNLEQKYRRWPHIAKRLTLHNLSWLGFALLRVK